MSRSTRVWSRDLQNKLVPKHHCGGCGTWNRVEGTRKRVRVTAEYSGDTFCIRTSRLQDYIPPYTCPTCLTRYEETWSLS